MGEQNLTLFIGGWIVLGFLVGLSPSVFAQFSESAPIVVGKNPTRVAISPDGNEVYVLNTDDDTVSIVSIATNSVVATKRVGVKPVAIAFSRDGAKAYIGLRGTEGQYSGSGVVVFDTIRRQPAPSTILPGRNCPVSDLALHPEGKKLYVAFIYCGLYRLDTISETLGSIDTRICPESVAFTPDGKRAYVNYQCAPHPGVDGHDPIFTYDAQTDKPDGAITHSSPNGNSERIANVGSWLAVSPDGRQVWANGADACARSADGPKPETKPSELTWWQALKVANGAALEQTPFEERLDKLARQLADKLSRTIGPHLRRNHAVLARALWINDARAPEYSVSEFHEQGLMPEEEDFPAGVQEY